MLEIQKLLHDPLQSTDKDELVRTDSFTGKQSFRIISRFRTDQTFYQQEFPGYVIGNSETPCSARGFGYCGVYITGFAMGSGIFR